MTFWDYLDRFWPWLGGAGLVSLLITFLGAVLDAFGATVAERDRLRKAHTGIIADLRAEADRLKQARCARVLAQRRALWQRRDLRRRHHELRRLANRYERGEEGT